MSDFKFNCPHCEQPLEAQEDILGQTIDCPTCNGRIQLPEPKVEMLSPKTQVPVGVRDETVERPADAQISLPPSRSVALPKQIPASLTSPDARPCFVDVAVDGAVIKGDVDFKMVLQTLADTFAKRLKNKFYVQIASRSTDVPCVHLKVLRMDAGNRFLRYFLCPFAGRTCVEVEGDIVGADARKDFRLRDCRYAGLFGGGSESLLKYNAEQIATKLSKLTRKTLR